MATPGENVHAFRNIVDETIAQSIRGAGNVSWPSMHEVAEVGGLTFVSVGKDRPRPMAIGLHDAEHSWGIIQSRTRVGKYAGELAMVSLAGKDDSLIRSWDMRSPMGPMCSVASQREITDPAHIEAAASWALSPHLKGSVLETLGELLPEEETSIAARMAKMGENAAELEADLIKLEEARRRAWQEAPFIIIR